MGSKNHNPSIARKISREIKQGTPPESLLNLAKTIDDPYYRSLSFVSIASSIKGRKSKEFFDEAISNLRRVNQAWRRIELLGKITKILKLSAGDKKDVMFDRILNSISNEKGENAKEFFVKYSKNFPDEVLDSLLNKSLSLKNYEFESSKAVIRIWIKQKPVDSLVSTISKVKGELRPRLLGYLHFQLNKYRIKIKPTALSLALKSPNTEEILKYLVRICSTSSDLNEIDKVSESSPSLMLALTARADRKGFSKEAENFVTKAENLINSLQSSNKKDKLLQKLKLTKDRLHSLDPQESPKLVSELPEIAKAGKHTLGLFNTYSGKWNHPHFKAIHKAAVLCSAFDLDLALIGFPKIDDEKLVEEIKKEMRLANDGYLASMFSKNRVRFFESDIDESWAGSKVATTARPDTNKLNLPDGKLCMVMGLGPKGLPKPLLESSSYHFELTGSNIAFETGTAMGSIAGCLSMM